MTELNGTNFRRQKKLNTVQVIAHEQMFLYHVKIVKIATSAQEKHNTIHRLYKRNLTAAIVCDMEIVFSNEFKRAPIPRPKTKSRKQDNLYLNQFFYFNIEMLIKVKI